MKNSTVLFANRSSWLYQDDITKAMLTDNEHIQGSKRCAMLNSQIEENWYKNVLNFWFVDLKPADWFKANKQTDHLIAQRFGNLPDCLLATPIEQLSKDMNIALAGVIGQDQFARNLFRTQTRAFHYDGHALALAKAAIAKGFDQQMPKEYCHFLYMPFMHSESLEDQKESIKLFKAIDKNKQDNPHAIEHYEVIVKFGRFPHRNKVLGRTDTHQEEIYLKDANRFGQ